MKRVTGIGGIFIKSADTKRMREWYQKHLGIDIAEWGGLVPLGGAAQSGRARIHGLEPVRGFIQLLRPERGAVHGELPRREPAPLLAELRKEGCQVIDNVDESEFGKFGWVLDPDGNKIELWEPPPGQ